jgi:hypothetical protein
MSNYNTKFHFSALVLWAICWSFSDVSAFQTPKPIPVASTPSAAVANAARATAAATLAVLLTVGAPVEPAVAASGAAQIMVDQIPPSTISIQVGDIPVVGSIISGTYAKLDKNAVKQLKSPPSVVISSPKDTFKAVKAAASEGHIEIDIGGKVGLKSHVDVDLAATEAGVAKVRVASNLIPSLPFKNLASDPYATGKEKSQWNLVTNMGNGESYYYNSETGVTQYEKPSKF